MATIGLPRAVVWCKRGALVFLGAILGLATAEGCLRARLPRGADGGFQFALADPALAESRGQFSVHPTRFFALAAPFRMGAGHAGLYALSPWPFRGLAAEPLPADTARIAVLGDSCVFGLGVAARDTLAGALQGALERRADLSPERLLVSGMGVPGYSTVQIRALLEEQVLARWRPRAVVLYLAAWNDNGPALGDNDVVRRSHREAWAWLSALGARALRATLVAGRVAREGLPEPWSEAQVLQAWEAGNPPFGRRVPGADLEREVAAMVLAAKASGAEVVCVLPAHREGVREQFPGLGEDRRSVERAAIAGGAWVVDGDQVFRAGPLALERYLLDRVHPSAEGFALLGEAIADVLAPRMQVDEVRPALEVASVSPARLSALGDEEIHIELRGATDGEPLFFLAGAPLLDVQSTGSGRYRGRTTRNSEGAADLVVVAPAGVARRPAAAQLVAPRLRVEARGVSPGSDPAPLLHFAARPGDTARLIFARELAPHPTREFPGSDGWLAAEGRIAFPVPMEAGSDGTAQIELNLAALPEDARGRWWVCALVTPRGAQDQPILNLWTEPIPVDL